MNENDAAASRPSSGEITLEALEDVHQKLGQLTRQLHDALQGLGLAEKLHGSAAELPDARTRLTYIARLTGEAAEKVLNRVDQAKSQNDHLAAQTKHMIALLVADPVAAVAKGHIMNFLNDLEKSNGEVDQHLTEIMMAQDFHDLTGQVIARVVHLAANIEDQLLELLIQTAPADVQAQVRHQREQAKAHDAAQEAELLGTAGLDRAEDASSPAAGGSAVDQVKLSGPVVDPEKMAGEVVTNQSEVDDLLASLGF